MQKKIKILFVAEELATNGAMMSMLALLSAIPSNLYEISLFLFNHGKIDKELVPNHITILPELYPYSAHRMSLKQSVFTSIKKQRFDMVLYRILLSFQRYFRLDYKLWHFLPSVPGVYDVVCSYADGFVAPMAEKKVNATKRACWIHFTYSDWQQEKYVYESLKRANICIPVSIEAGHDLDKVLREHISQFVIHNITDAETCILRALECCDIPRKKDVKRIVSVGRVTSQKGFDLIPNIAKELFDRRLNFEWIILGDGEDRGRIVKQLLQYGLDEFVHFIGNRANPMPYIESADVFVNPSRYESWGMTISEALCLGKAIVASDLPVFKEQIKDGVNGLMRPNVPSILAEAIEMVLTDDALRHKLERNALNYPYTKEKIVAEFNSMIEKLLNIKL